MKKLFLPLLLILTFHSAIAQFSWNAELSLQGMASTEEEELPFWMYHNQRGRIEKETNFASWASGKAFYDLDKAGLLEAGAGLLVRDANSDKLFTDELYLTYTKDWLEFTAGRKQRPELYNGLSASNESILWSLNARPLPGIQLKTTRPVFILNNFGFEAAWEEYLMDDERFVDNTRLHHKSFHLIYRTATKDFLIKAGIQHFAQWAGESPVVGEQPKSFKDYFRIISGKQGIEGATKSDQLNALGNHLGGYEFSVLKFNHNFNLEIFYQHLFEDGSGSRLGNTPDGRYGICIILREQKKFVNSMIYEFYTTHHQSHTTTGFQKNDNYFNNGLGGYGSGWTYYQKVIGAPFFTVDPEEIKINKLPIINNKFTAHHFGIGGNFMFNKKPISYDLLLSYAQNDGRRDQRYIPKQDVFYAVYKITFKYSSLNFNFNVGAQYDSYKAPIYGVGIDLNYKI